MLDGPQVYADFELTAPVADALPGGTAIQLFPTFTLNSNPFYVNETLNLTQLAGSIVLLIFTWVNDDNGIGSGPPALADAITVKYCIKNTSHNVTGGEGYCIGSAGTPVGLDGSVTGINYQLYLTDVYGTNPVGSPVAGTAGSPINFGRQTGVGTYTVVGTTGECTYNITGSVTVTQNPLPVPSAESNSPICSGSALKSYCGGWAYL